jgi:hypothetical protein
MRFIYRPKIAFIFCRCEKSPILLRSLLHLRLIISIIAPFAVGYNLGNAPLKIGMVGGDNFIAQFLKQSGAIIFRIVTKLFEMTIRIGNVSGIIAVKCLYSKSYLNSG